MPLDLNTIEPEELADRVAHLPNGHAIMTCDGLVVRKPLTAPGYDCGVGAGGYGQRRARTIDEAVDYLFRSSAAATHPESLGGATSYNDYEKAMEDVRKGTAEAPGPSPALKALRRLVNNADLHSYRTRAEMARDALRKGDIAKAVRQVEAILQHASDNGRAKDVERASVALRAIADHHEIGSYDVKTTAKIEIRPREGQHYVFQDGVQKAGPLNRGDAEAFKRFLEREAVKIEDQQAIQRELEEEPTALREDAA